MKILAIQHRISLSVAATGIRRRWFLLLIIHAVTKGNYAETMPEDDEILNNRGLHFAALEKHVSTLMSENETLVSVSLLKQSEHSIHEHAGTIDDESHECLRECHSDIAPMKCHYHFTAEWYTSMSKACHSCPHNVTDCARPHCVPTDGLKRAIVTINRRLPGPSIQVCAGDEIIVDVENLLMTDTTTIHWHGLHQVGTPYMDGVPMLTQCPILPFTTFRYHFLAENVGTHYWHSHSGFQRADGVYGSLIIRAKDDNHRELYDIDDPGHHFILSDWMDGLGVDKFVHHHHNEHDNKPYNILINGLGKYAFVDRNGDEKYNPVQEFRVNEGLRYRFRAVSNSVQNCPMEISVDDHTLLVIASDGQDIQPVEFDSLVIYGGERWDFVLHANQTAKSYWMKIRGLLDCDDRFHSAYQVAVVRYEESNESDIPEPMENLNYESTKRQGLQLNKLNVAPGDFKTFLTAADVRSFNTHFKAHDFSREPSYKFWLDFDFYGKDNPMFHHEQFYPFYEVETRRRLFLPQMNSITLTFPPSPPLSQREDIKDELFCNATSRTECTKFCSCVHTINLKLGSLVELILVDKGVVYYANHPFHLHGHTFAVLAMGKIGEETTLEKVKKLEKEGKIIRNFDNPPIKDSVTVPDGGYTIIRFIANNPGYWFFHCHLTFHVEVGMGLIFHIGEKDHLPSPPQGFPKCGTWTPKPREDLLEEVKKWSESIGIVALNGDDPNTQYSYETKKNGSSRSSISHFLHSIAIVFISLWLTNSKDRCLASYYT